MPAVLQFRRYKTSDINIIDPGKIGEIFIELDDANKPISLRIQDGITPGGKIISSRFGDLSGSVSDNSTLQTAFDAKLSLTDFSTHVNGNGSRHVSSAIDYTTGDEGVTVEDALDELFTLTENNQAIVKVREELIQVVAVDNTSTYEFTQEPIKNSEMIFIDGIYQQPDFYEFNTDNVRQIIFNFIPGPLSTVRATYEAISSNT